MFAQLLQQQENTSPIMKSTQGMSSIESRFIHHATTPTPATTTSSATTVYEPTPLIDADVDCIVNAVDHLLDYDDKTLDPTPIGSSGLKIVDKVNLDLTESPWLDDDNFVACLTSFLGQKRKAAGVDYKMFQKKDIVSKWKSTSKQEPCMTLVDFPHKRQRMMDSTSAAVTSDDSSTTSSQGSGSTISTADDSSMLQLRPYQSDQWYEKYRKLVQFKRINGHCLVPNNWNLNSPLALWVKRQRYQYKLKNEGQHSTLTEEREQALEALGFVWDSHGAVWEERLNELRGFKNVRGHCCVPANFKENHQLAIWVKCQRRQYKLFCDGKRSNMNQERIAKLEDLGFVWNPRKMKASSPATIVPNI